MRKDAPISLETGRPVAGKSIETTKAHWFGPICNVKNLNPVLIPTLEEEIAHYHGIMRSRSGKPHSRCGNDRLQNGVCRIRNIIESDITTEKFLGDDQGVAIRSRPTAV